MVLVWWYRNCCRWERKHARGVYTPGIGGYEKKTGEEEECGGRERRSCGRGVCVCVEGEEEEEERRTGLRGVRGAKKEEQGGIASATCAQASGNGHRGVASSSACQPALPEMHRRTPRDENATGEKPCGEKPCPFRRVRQVS